MKKRKIGLEMSFVTIIIMISEVLKDFNDSILLYWYQWFIPNFTRDITRLPYEEMWEHITIKKLPYFTIMTVIICLSKVIQLLGREERLFRL